MSGLIHGARASPGLRRLQASTSLERAGWILILVLMVLTVGAWALTLDQARSTDMPMGIVPRTDVVPDHSAANASGMDDMPGMAMSDPAPDQMVTMQDMGMSGMTWSVEAFLAFLFAWSVMMAAMMFPAAAPMLLFFQKVATQRKGERWAIVATWIFAAGYLLTWIGVGIATWALIRVISDAAGQLTDSDRETWAPLGLGFVMILAGLYQFTPLKRVCLHHCQSPIGFVMSHWREGRSGALQMGLRHGVYCLGCCWMLFAVLVATGVMSLPWMLVLTLVVFAEKVLRFGTRVGHVSGAAFIVLGAIIAVGIADVPWKV